MYRRGGSTFLFYFLFIFKGIGLVLDQVPQYQFIFYATPSTTSSLKQSNHLPFSLATFTLQSLSPSLSLPPLSPSPPLSLPLPPSLSLSPSLFLSLSFRMYGLFQTTFYFSYSTLSSLSIGIICGKKIIQIHMIHVFVHIYMNICTCCYTICSVL